MRGRPRDLISGILYIALLITLAFIVVENIEEPWNIITLSILLFISFIVRNVFIYSSFKYKEAGIISILFDTAAVFGISLLDKGSSSLIYYLIIISDIIINYSLPPAIFSTFTGYALYTLDLCIRFSFSMPEVIPRAIFNSLAFAGVFTVMYLAKYFIRQSALIEKTMKELTVKTLEQERTYNELKEAYGKLEEMTMLKERNRIAGEIHDTVGHTLTTVLVEMEIGKKLASKDMAMSLERFSAAQEQVRKGLNDLRNSVRMLERGDEIMDFVPSLNSLIKDTEKHTGIVIKSEIDISSNIEEVLKRTIYNALSEGLTNGIRHGKSTAFVFKLIERNGHFEFSLEDNGIGGSLINLGFGLKSMKERIREYGGSFKIDPQPERGFGLYLEIPVNRMILR